MMDYKTRLAVSFTLFLLFISGPLHAAVDAGLLQAAQNMIARGNSVEALDLLDPHEEEYAGNKEYDYLYGLALLDTGEPASAVFAFQRVLAVDPNFAGARLELGRSYFDMGQMQRAHREFTLLMSQSPPKNVVDVINKYMAAIESRNLRNRRGWRGFVQLGFGNDSNVNNATGEDSFLGFDLAEDSRETPSSVVSALGGASYDLPLNVSSKLYFKGSLNQRSNSDAAFTNTVNYDLLAGYSKALSGSDFSIALQLYSADVDGAFNNQGVNLTGQYNLNFSPSDQLGMFLRTGYIDYQSAFDVKDVDQNVLGVSFAHVFGRQTRLSLIMAAILGQDSASQSDSPYGRDYTGLRLSASYPLTHRLNLFASVGSTASDYGGSFFDDPSKRKDTLSDISLGASWRINKSWLLRAVAGQSDNSSSIDIFDYEKSVIMFTARSEFLP